MVGLQRDAAGGGRQKARDQPQQRGLARAIGAFHRQRLAGRDLEIQVREQRRSPRTQASFSAVRDEIMASALTRKSSPFDTPSMRLWHGFRREEFCGLSRSDGAMWAKTPMSDERRTQDAKEPRRQYICWPPLIDMVEPVMNPRIVGHQEQHAARDLLGLAQPPDRNAGDDLLQHVGRHRRHHVGVDIAGRDGVDGDALGGAFLASALVKPWMPDLAAA